MTVFSKIKPILSVPDSWDKVTFSQFLRVKPGMRVTEVLSILLEKPEPEILLMDLDIEKAFTTLSFLDKDIPQESSEMNLEAESLARYEDMRLYVKQMTGTAEDFKHYPVIFATYWQRPYNSDTVDGLIKYVQQKPCTLVIGHVQHYLREMNRIEEKWGVLFPKSSYTSEQQAAGYPQISEFFGHYQSLVHAERNSKWDRDEWSEKTVAEFKYFMLLLARENESHKKYSEGQALRAKTKKK